MSIKKHIIYFQALFFVIVLEASTAFSQVVVDGTKTTQQLVQDVLLGPGVTASNITFMGAKGAIGFFNGSNSNIGIDSGLVLTSGNIVNVPGPNNSSSAGTSNGLQGDQDLTGLAGTDTYDAAILEFDFYTSSNQVKFTYVFGSDEYMEYVGSINDAFGFFVSGPGINGTQNVALIPNTSLPVTISSVNLYNNGTYYVDNENPTGLTVQYDGFTTPLEAVFSVIPCQTYHIKLAIADAGDYAYDSGVFLEAKSFSSGITISYLAASVDSGIQDSIAYTSSVVVNEGCGQGKLTFVRPGIIDSAEVVYLSIGGDALSGIDYASIIDSLYFAPGQDSLSFDFSSFSDNITEGTEFLTVKAIEILCGDSVVTNFTLEIKDIEMLVANASDYNICKGDSVLLNVNISGGSGNYQLLWDNLPDSSEYILYENLGNYIVHVSDGCGNKTTDTANISSLNFVSGLSVAYESLNQINFNSVNGTVVSWDFGDGSTSTESNPTHEYQKPGSYKVTVVVENSLGCLDTSYTTIDIYENFQIANTFTPNGDNINDSFSIPNIGLKTYSLMIYNRWGKLLFESTDPTQSWDGKTKSGNQVEAGTYFYVLTAISPFNDFSGNGSINLIRN